MPMDKHIGSISPLYVHCVELGPDWQCDKRPNQGQFMNWNAAISHGSKEYGGELHIKSR